MNDTVKDKPALTRESLAAGAAAPRSKLFVGAAILLALAAIAAGYFAWRSGAGSAPPQYRAEAVARGNLVVLVSATGSLQPTNKVDIGSELSGIVEAVLVDDNDVVKQGQVLARLDLSKLEDQVARSRSSLVAAEARVRQTAATVTALKATVRPAVRTERLCRIRTPANCAGTVRSELRSALYDRDDRSPSDGDRNGDDLSGQGGSSGTADDVRADHRRAECGDPGDANLAARLVRHHL